MKRYNFIVAILFALIFSGCNNIQPTPTYNKDYSNEKVFYRHIVLSDEYKAKSIINQLNNSTNKLHTFIDLKKTYSISVSGKPTNNDNGFWGDSTNINPYVGNVLFNLKVGEYSTNPLHTTAGYTLMFLEKRISKQQFKQLQENEKQKNLDRMASYETNYLNEYQNILKTIPKMQITYIQPYNKKEPCKIWMRYHEGNELFKEDSYKIFWDGKCKNGYASGLGREIETADMIDKWGIAIYKKGKPTYYIINNILSNILFEGINIHNQDDNYGVETIIKDKPNDIEVTTIAGKRNYNKGRMLLSITSPFWNSSYTYVKEYFNFRYKYFNNKGNDTNNNEFEFFIEDKNGKNGWAINKNKNGNIITGEYVNNVAKQFNLPKTYNQKADAILKEIYNAQQKAFQAQGQAQKVKKQYLKRICKDSVKVKFMDNNEYKEICHPKSELAIIKKINNKLNKLSEAKIAKLEKERYTAQQQKEEQNRQELLQIERNRLSEIRRHNQETEAAADAAHFQQGMKNLTDQINNMTPKTYNVNMFHY
jgi:hypothetical protein